MTQRRGPYAKSAMRRDAILDAALKVFATNGYWNGSLEEIATEVGVTKPALRYYFPSKEELFTGVLERWDTLAFVVSPLDVSDPVEALRGLVRLTERNLSIPGVIALHTMTSIEATNPAHPAHEFYIRRYEFFRERITEILEGCERLGLLAPGVVPARAARSLGAVMDGLQIQWLTDSESVDLVGDVAHHIEGLLVPAAGWTE
ncbi:TetR/AcrR family transcriptional regulator [Microbacterium sp. B2969]|uniref:TetR/AcrR family transcriptional regulator n=1 Tax=Microbacterium alkaliflavum TaxID=3248839 RepID=A0ABW7QDS0_9MICO